MLFIEFQMVGHLNMEVQVILEVYMMAVSIVAAMKIITLDGMINRIVEDFQLA